MTTIQSVFKLGMKRDLPEILDVNGGLVLNLGPGESHIEGTVGLEYPDWDANKMPIPYDDESVDAIHAYHFLEHVDNPILMLHEIQRVLKPGGVLQFCVPYYNAQCQAQDLTHKSVWCETTFQNLFSNEYYSKDREGWKLKVGFILICGIVERNICLIGQLIKE